MKYRSKPVIVESEDYGMTQEQFAKLKHAWGYDSKSPGFRDYYYDIKFSPDLLRLVELGFMTGPYMSKSSSPDMAHFFVSANGKELLQKIKAQYEPAGEE
jgi:hypothetical protein